MERCTGANVVSLDEQRGAVMRAEVLFMLLPGLVAIFTPTIVGADQSRLVGPETPAFSAAPLPDTSLASIRGEGIDRRLLDRQAVDDLSIIGFQETASIARVAMDNWWGQTGASLIAENLLARP